MRQLNLSVICPSNFPCVCLTVSVKDVLELSDGRWDLQSEVEDLLLSLKSDILWPSDHAGEVAGGLDVLADAIVAGTLLDERVLHCMSEPVTMRDRVEAARNPCMGIFLRTLAGFFAPAFP